MLRSVPDDSRLTLHAVGITEDTALAGLPIELFLAAVRQRDIKLALDGDRLRASAPAGTLTLELKRAIADRKPELIEYLSRNEGIRPRAGDYVGSHPVSFAQERLWFLDQLDGASAVYNVPIAVRIRGPLQLEALRESLTALVERHAVLRTVVELREGVPVQTIVPPVPVTMATLDLRSKPLSEREDELAKALTREARRPFDLARGPLFRALLVRMADADAALLITLHHAVCDAWSLGILNSNLATIYAARVEGLPCPLPPLPVQYVDYARWQRERLTGAELARLVEYWRTQLAGAPLQLDLPTDHPRPATPGTRGDCIRFELPQPLVTGLKQVCRAEDATLFMGLLATFGVLLGRHTNQQEVLIGAPIAGRTRAEVQHVVGLFVNTLAMRVDMTGEPSFVDVLHRVRETALGAYAHQDLPFEKLVEVLQPDRSRGEHPLVQTMLVLDNTPAVPGTTSPDMLVEPIDVQTGTAKFDLSLSLAETASGMQGWLEYNSDLFDLTTIERLVRRWRVLLEASVAEPTRSIGELPLLDAAEREQVVMDWNATTVEYPRVSLAEAVERTVDRTPMAAAVVFGDQTLTYGELERRSNRLARYLRQCGVGPGKIVGLSLERSPEMVVALLAVAKAGGAYLPLDPSYPYERRAFMLRDSAAHVLVVDGRAGSDLPPSSGRIVRLDAPDDRAAIAASSSERLTSTASPDDPAYVIYTSGSTGVPKGVVVPHRAVLNLLAGVQQQPGIAAGDTVLAITSLSFDIAVFDLWAPLAVGARIVLAPGETAADGVLLRGLLEGSGATILQATPATWRLLIEAGWRGGRPLKAISTGEALPRDLAAQLVERSDDVWNMYGPTETTVWSTAWQVPRAVDAVLIGKPMANTQLYVLDRHQQLVPVGVQGELYIGGDGVADGYLGRAELTAERFAENPYMRESGGRMYRTGDLVRWRTDGRLEYFGRNDGQVKLRGFRIELEEIEARLRQHPSVRDAAVAPRTDQRGDQRLVAYLALRENAGIDPAQVRAFVRQQLPEYMVPSAYLLVTELPLTPNGKVDRHALPQPLSTSSSQTDTYVAPRDQIERQLAELWEELLGTSPIGVRDNFFDLGGHSLLAARLVFRVQNAFGRNLPVATLLRSATIEELAGLLRAPEDATVWEPLVTLQRGEAGRRPIFFVHGAFGDVLCYSDLARALGQDQPCYVLQAIGLDGVRPPLDRVPDMASAYVDQLRTIQPRGPYCLAGFSVGGTIAFEMACQLEAMGDEVGLLGVFDHPLANGAFLSAPPLPVFLARFTRNLVLNIPHWLRMARGVERDRWKTALYERYRLGRRAAERLFAKHAPSLDQVMAEVEEMNGLEYLTEWPAYRRRVLECQFRAMQSYELHRTYSGRLTLFRARRQPLVSTHDPHLGWDSVIEAGVEVVDVPGNHNQLLRQERCIGIIAERLRTRLTAL
jgi:amino acid adenylation domain-containing protein